MNVGKKNRKNIVKVESGHYTPKPGEVSPGRKGTNGHGGLHALSCCWRAPQMKTKWITAAYIEKLPFKAYTQEDISKGS